MRKNTLMIAIIFLLTMTACSNQNRSYDAVVWGSNSQEISATMIFDGVWPENEYTEDVPVPPGTVTWVMTDSKEKYCAVNIEGINEEQYDHYMKQLRESGFSVTNEVSEEVEGQDYVSIGTILSDGERGISISFIPGNLGLRISFV